MTLFSQGNDLNDVSSHNPHIMPAPPWEDIYHQARYPFTVPNENYSMVETSDLSPAYWVAILVGGTLIFESSRMFHSYSSFQRLYKQAKTARYVKSGMKL